MATISVKTGFQMKAEILVEFLPSVISHFSSVCLHVLLQLHQGMGLVGIHYTLWGSPEPEVQRVQVRTVQSPLMLCSQADEIIPKKVPEETQQMHLGLCGVAPSCMNQVNLNCPGVSFWDRPSWNL